LALAKPSANAQIRYCLTLIFASPVAGLLFQRFGPCAIR
jgi:hypothetical protein